MTRLMPLWGSAGGSITSPTRYGDNVHDIAAPKGTLHGRIKGKKNSAAASASLTAKDGLSSGCSVALNVSTRTPPLLSGARARLDAVLDRKSRHVDGSRR